MIDLVVEPELRERCGTVASPDDGEPVRVCDRMRDGVVPEANRSSSNTPIGPFQKTMFASAMTSANSAALPGPMS